MNKFVLLNVNLSSFDEGAAPAGGEGSSATSGEGGVASTQSTEQEVVYGKVEEQQNVDTTDKIDAGKSKEGDQPDLNAQFEDLIKGDYKEQFDTRVQKIIDKRFKSVKQMESQLGEMQPVIDLMMKKHGVESVEDLFAKVEGETIEELAYAEGVTPEQYKKLQEAEKLKAMYQKEQQSQTEKQIMQQKVQSWYEQSEAMKEAYPDFQLKDWSQNNEFLKLLNADIPVRQAYELLNMDNIKANVAKQAQENTSKAIQEKKNRPAESAAKSSNGVVIKSNVNDLSKEDRAEIARRVSRGEKISF